MLVVVFVLHCMALPSFPGNMPLTSHHECHLPHRDPAVNPVLLLNPGLTSIHHTEKLLRVCPNLVGLGFMVRVAPGLQSAPVVYMKVIFLFCLFPRMYGVSCVFLLNIQSDSELNAKGQM